MKNYPHYKHERLYTLQELLHFCSETFDSKIAFTYPQTRNKCVDVTYSQFKQDVEALGTHLYHNGSRDCHIAIYGENSYEWILSHFAVTCGGNVAVPIDKELDVSGIAELLTDSECKVLIYSDTYQDNVEQLQKSELNIVYINMKDIPVFIDKGNELIEKGNVHYLNIQVNKDDLATIVYTSGTTGKSKGVMLTHGNLTVDSYAGCCNVASYGTSMLILPLHHTYGLVAAVFSEMLYGYPIYINRSLKQLQQDFLRAKPQNFFAVPLIVETLYKQIWSTAKKQGKDKVLKLLIRVSDTLLKCKIDLRKLFFKSIIDVFGGNLNQIMCGGAPLDTKYIKAFGSLGITLLNGYGITECAPMVSSNRNQFNIVGSVGVPLCCNEVKIADDGEVLVKGDNVMQGYYHNKAENEKVFVDGWFRTGDIGYIDEHRALHITGRIKNLIILSNGENISAESIEEAVYTIPYVKEVIAYGKDNVIVAEVFLDENVPDAKERINADIQTINKKLSLVRNIGRVVVRDTEFEKTTTKKIKRNYGGSRDAR